jgi:transcriptional regulator with XRE-family HTH domain
MPLPAVRKLGSAVSLECQDHAKTQKPAISRQLSRRLEGFECGQRSNKNSMRLKGKSQIDRAIGQRLRAYRLAAGMSQAAVGDHLGVTFQQIQKYEKGVNRLSGARLVAVTNLLHVKPELLLGTNGSGPSQDEFAALNDRNINKIVIARSGRRWPSRSYRWFVRSGQRCDLIRSWGNPGRADTLFAQLTAGLEATGCQAVVINPSF